MSTTEPPHSDEFEAGLIGAILASATTAPEVIDGALEEGLTTAAFYRRLYGRVFAAAVLLNRAGDSVDRSTVIDAMKRTSAVTTAEERQVKTLPGISPTSETWRTQARRLAELARLRGQREAGLALAAAVDRGDEAGVTNAIASLSAIDAQAITNRQRPIEERQEAMWAMAEGRGTVWTTPFAELNGYLSGGMRPGQFTTLGGWASHGKSVLAVQVARFFRDTSGAKVAIYTNEMETEEFDGRTIANEANVSYWRFVQGQIKPDEQAAVARAITAMPKNALTVIEAGGMSADEIAYDIRRRRWDIAVIDLLNGILDAVETKDIDRNMAVLSTAARQSGAHILACQHLNQARHVGKDYPPMPAPADIRGSGAIYNLSNNVLFIYLEARADEPTEPSEHGILRVAKARGGIRGSLNVEFRSNRGLEFVPMPAPGTTGTL